MRQPLEHVVAETEKMDAAAEPFFLGQPVQQRDIVNVVAEDGVVADDDESRTRLLRHDACGGE